MRDFLKQLTEARASEWEQAKALLDSAAKEGRDLSGDETQTYERLNASIDERDAKIKDLLEREQREVDAAKAREQFAHLYKSDDERKDEPKDSELRKFLRGEAGRSFEARANGPVDFRALAKGTATAGGNTVQTSFYDRLVAHLIEVSGIMAAGPTVLNTDSGENLQVPKTTQHSTAALVAEGSAINASDPTFGQVTLGAYKYGVLIQVSRELLTDTSVDLEGYLAMQAGRALGNAFGAHAVTGSGSGQPNGVVTAATAGVTGGTGVTGAFTSDNLIDLHYSVIAPYRASASCSWLVKDSTLGAIRKLKDSQGRYLWEPSLVPGAPDTLLGKPVRTDPNVAAPAVSAKSVVFGDFSQYFVRMVNGIRFEMSNDYAFNTDLVTYRALLRADGNLVDQTGAIKVFQGAAT